LPVWPEGTKQIGHFDVGKRVEIVDTKAGDAGLNVVKGPGRVISAKCLTVPEPSTLGLIGLGLLGLGAMARRRRLRSN
jgi:hypothetical protein